jgi:hypothetical protein
VSKPYLRNSGLAINENVYLNECIRKRLIPYIKEKHSDDNYIFWPDKASSHYASKVINEFNDQNIKYVLRSRNPTNVPQVRPIEDFFGSLCQIVYAKGWKAKNINQLKNRIKFCLKNIDLNVVTRTLKGVVKRLRIAGQQGVLSVVH